MRHNVVTRRNGLGDRLALFNQVLRIIQPHVRAVGIAGNAHHFTKILRLYIVNHLAHEGCATFRNAIGAYRAANIIRLNA